MSKEVIVFTSGSWDLFHVGHLNMLRQSKALGTKLVVGVSTDELIEEYKGLPPVIPFEQRMEIVSAITYVDVVVKQTILTEIRQLQEFNIDIVTIGDDWTDRYLEGLEWMKEHGRVEYLPYTESVSTTRIKRQIIDSSYDLINAELKREQEQPEAWKQKQLEKQQDSTPPQISRLPAQDDQTTHPHTRIRMTLSEIKRRTVNHYAAWWTILGIDPIAYRIVWVIQRVHPNLNPNVLTVCSLIAGVGAAVGLASGHYWIGGLLYELAFLFDCLDGKMARLQGKSSAFGGFFDGLVNTTVYGLALIGLAWSDLGNPMLVGGVMGALVIHLIGVDQSNFQKVHGGASSFREPSDDTSTWGRLKENKPLMWPDRHLFVFLICPVLGVAAYGVLANLLVDTALQARRFIRICQSTAGGTCE